MVREISLSDRVPPGRSPDCSPVQQATPVFVQLTMASAAPFVLRWGIISTGKISASFVKVSNRNVQLNCILLTKVP